MTKQKAEFIVMIITIVLSIFTKRYVVDSYESLQELAWYKDTLLFLAIYTAFYVATSMLIKPKSTEKAKS